MIDLAKNKTPALSVVVTTYNKERELALVLEAYRHQNFQDFELVVADDGSSPETRTIIEKAKARSSFPIIHSWQEDKGFRAARSRNLAVSKCRGKILVLTDGDCIPLPDYLAIVQQSYKESCYLAGERYLLSREEAEPVDNEKIALGAKLYLESLIPDREQKRLRKARRKNRFYRTFRLKIRPTVMTCNFAISKNDLMKINGFDERYVGWGHEDTDLGRRLRSAGIKSANELSKGRVLHLWHKTESSFAGRVRDCANASYFNRGFYLSRCRNGLKHRKYNDLNIYVECSNLKIQKQAEESLSGQNKPKEAEIAVLLHGKEKKSAMSFPKGIEVPILVLEKGSPLPWKLIKKTGLILTQEELCSDALKGFDGAVEKLQSTAFNQEAFEEIRQKIDEIL
jgi:glycosyltransferase involved in cell wall biosynthesis